MTLNSKILGAAAAILLASGATAQASPAEPVSVAVRYADLDLSSPKGRTMLENRIEAAAREMCGMDSALTTGSRMPSYSMRACYKKATSDIGQSIARAVEKREAKS
jgi:UrcA family protein